MDIDSSYSNYNGIQVIGDHESLQHRKYSKSLHVCKFVLRPRSVSEFVPQSIASTTIHYWQPGFNWWEARRERVSNTEMKYTRSMWSFNMIRKVFSNSILWRQLDLEPGTELTEKVPHWPDVHRILRSARVSWAQFGSLNRLIIDALIARLSMRADLANQFNLVRPNTSLSSLIWYRKDTPCHLNRLRAIVNLPSDARILTFSLQILDSSLTF
jgi:hypothetical protein